MLREDARAACSALPRGDTEIRAAVGCEEGPAAPPLHQHEHDEHELGPEAHIS